MIEGQGMFIDAAHLYQTVDAFHEDQQLKGLIAECFERSMDAAAGRAAEWFRTDPRALEEVSEHALARILASDGDVSDIRTHDISNCLVFHTDKLAGTVLDDRVRELRRRIDVSVIEKLVSMFCDPVSAEVSGHFWYPPGGYMGWHTNLRKPGWRFYVNYAEEPGRSFFRYRDPQDGRIVTSTDERWNFRLFLITPDAPFWHCVYSETNRFSLGYKVTPAGPR